MSKYDADASERKLSIKKELTDFKDKPPAAAPHRVWGRTQRREG